ncbi:hypothetical protein ACFQMA_09795 [Halosimplex aquaticum]|uniref:Uncharacterized protein n=1 Tax=Halosimplex aquaticum TaxID=3026162 RepID=A0ABD5XYD1_9EURY|nr:hypothetical protein [Halosimplex aquaticum]
MEEAAAVRVAATDAVGDVEPDRLRERIRERLEDGSMAPGVLTVLSARAAASRAPESDAPSISLDAVAERGAGVQLIYEGLRLTRTLSQDPPWERDAASVAPGSDELADGVPETGVNERSSGTERSEWTDGGDVTLSDADRTPADPAATTEADAADMDILVADVMVARGFYLLARTEAAAEAVAVVRSFGGDQTRRRTSGDETFDGNLEVDVFELAAVAGATAAGGEATADLRAHVGDLARTEGALPLAEGLFSDATPAALAEWF